MAESPIRKLRDAAAPNTMLQPPGWPRPKGFANGMLARGEMVFVGGMIGQHPDGSVGVADCGPVVTWIWHFNPCLPIHSTLDVLRH